MNENQIVWTADIAWVGDVEIMRTPNNPYVMRWVNRLCDKGYHHIVKDIGEHEVRVTLLGETLLKLWHDRHFEGSGIRDVHGCSVESLITHSARAYMEEMTV